MTKTPTGGVKALSTVLHTLDLLGVLAQSDRPLRLADVVQRTGLGRATAYQRLLTLTAAGFLELDADQRYRLTMYPARLANAALAQAGISERAQAVMTELMQLTQETVSLAVLEQGRACIAARVETSMLLRADQKIGSHMPIEGSASGRVLAAWAPSELRQEVEAAGEVYPSEVVLEQVRREGHAVSNGYSHSGVTGLAAPVFGADGRCIGALSLAIPEQRYQIDLVLEPLKRASATLCTIFSGGKA